MKRGDFVKTPSGVGVVVAYHKEYDNMSNGYPWYVWINGKTHYFQTHQVKKVGGVR